MNYGASVENCTRSRLELLGPVRQPYIIPVDLYEALPNLNSPNFILRALWSWGKSVEAARGMRSVRPSPSTPSRSGKSGPLNVNI